jgi:hypothetical protein
MSAITPEQIEAEKIFRFRRRTLMAICIAIFFYNSGLSILINGAIENIVGNPHKNSLAAILFFWCLYALHRYHHAFRATIRWIKMQGDVEPFIDAALSDNRIIADELSEGISELDRNGYDWDSERLLYVIEREYYPHGKSYRNYRRKNNPMTVEELKKVKRLEVKSNIIAWWKFCLHDPHVTDNIFPYVFAALALLEISGMLQVTILLQAMGTVFTSNKLDVSGMIDFIYNVGQGLSAYIATCICTL